MLIETEACARVSLGYFGGREVECVDMIIVI